MKTMGFLFCRWRSRGISEKAIKQELFGIEVCLEENILKPRNFTSVSEKLYLYWKFHFYFREIVFVLEISLLFQRNCIYFREIVFVLEILLLFQRNCIFIGNFPTLAFHSPVWFVALQALQGLWHPSQKYQ